MTILEVGGFGREAPLYLRIFHCLCHAQQRRCLPCEVVFSDHCASYSFSQRGIEFKTCQIVPWNYVQK